jgi:hypothetical protein
MFPDGPSGPRHEAGLTSGAHASAQGLSFQQRAKSLGAHTPEHRSAVLEPDHHGFSPTQCIGESVHEDLPK